VAFLPGVGSVSTTKHFSSEDLTIHRSATTGVGVKVAMNRRVAASRDLKFVIIGNASWLQSLNKRVRELFIPAMFRKCLWRLAMKALMLVLLAAAILISGAITSVQAEDTFYIVYDKTMHGCTIATTEPSDKSRYKTEGRYQIETEAEKAITSIKEC
jgi:hypothetical protein